MKKIAILGASYLQKPLVDKAMALNHEVHCFAWDNAEAVCKETADFFYDISVLEKDLILEKCRAIGINGITTIATDICVPTICYVAQEMELVSNTYQTALLATNKGMMRKAFEDGNVNSPKSVAVSHAHDQALESMDFPLIVKPTDRSGSRGVAKVLDSAGLHDAINRAIGESIEKKAVVEEYIEGDEVSVETISWKGKHHILAITDKITTGEPYFVELQHHQPSALPRNIQEAIEAETIKALDALNLEYGAGHAEFKITKHGKVVAIEVGARMGGDFIGSHLVPLSTGFDYLKAVIDVALGEFDPPVTDAGNYSGVYFLSKESENLASYFEKPNTFDFEKKILKAELSAITNSNDRSGYLIYRDNKKITLP